MFLDWCGVWYFGQQSLQQASFGWSGNWWSKLKKLTINERSFLFNALVLREQLQETPIFHGQIHGFL